MPAGQRSSLACPCMGSGWDDLELDVVEGSDGRRLTTSISPMWELAVVPQGGIVAAMAVRAMERVLNDPSQTLRTMTAMFAGQVAGGTVVIEVKVLTRGRTMSPLTATVRNPDAEAGPTDRQRAREGKSVAVRVDLG